MKASPFWRRVMGVTAILCVITLITPTVYYLKYLVVDAPMESHAAQTATTAGDSLNDIRVVDIDYYTSLTRNPDAKTRIAGVQALGKMVLLPAAQMKYPIECLHAKLALEHTLQTDPDPVVRSAALSTLLSVASHGAVIKR